MLWPDRIRNGPLPPGHGAPMHEACLQPPELPRGSSLGWQVGVGAGVGEPPAQQALLLRSVNTDMGTGWRTGGSSTGSVTISASAVPEPGSASLLILGLAAVFATTRRYRR